MAVTLGRPADSDNGSHITVPIGEAFDRRLAELVWENCPELARQTAAGQLALTLNFKETDIASRVSAELAGEIVSDMKSKAIEAAKAFWSDEKPIKEVVDRVRVELEKRIEKEVGSRLDKAISDVIQGYLNECMYDRVRSAADAYFDGSFANVISSRVDALVEEHLDNRLSTNTRARESIRNGAAKFAGKAKAKGKAGRG